jgi:hypothetical protein
MNNKNVKKLVKNVIEENAVAFKTTLNRTLYSKVGQKLQEKYVELSQQIFEDQSSQSYQVDDSDNLVAGHPGYEAAGPAASTATQTPVYPKVKPPFTTPESVDPSRWGIDPNNPPDPMTREWKDAYRRYKEALEIYNRYLRSKQPRPYPDNPL